MNARRRLTFAVAATALATVTLASRDVSAATQGQGTATTTVTGGSLSLSSVGTASFSATLSGGTVTTAATSLNVGTYGDTTGSGAGWNGTVAVQQFVNTQAWVPNGTALQSNASAGYTSNAGLASYTVAVTANAATTVSVTWSGSESGSGTATKGSAFAVGTRGLTITFASAVTYLTTDTYTIKADVLPTSTLIMATGGSCTATGTTGSGTNLPVMTNTSATVTGGTYNTYGSAIKVITAPVGEGLGTFTCTPKATMTIDSNNSYPGSYVATAQFTIVTGP